MSLQGRHSLPRYDYLKPSQSATLSQASHQKSASSLITQSPGVSRIPSIPRSNRHDNIGGGVNSSFNTSHEGQHQQSQQNQRTSSSPYTRLNNPYSQHNSSMTSASVQNDISSYSHSQQSYQWGVCEEHGEPATNFCANVECLIALCPDCIDEHYRLHNEKQTVPQLESLKSVKKKCSTKIEVAVSQLKNQIVEFEESVQLDPQAMFREAMSRISAVRLELIQIIDRVFEGFETAAEKLVQENCVQAGELKQQLNEVNLLVYELQQLKNELDTSSSIVSISKICRLDVLSLRDQFRLRMQKAATQRDFCKPIDVQINEPAFQEFNQVIQAILTVSKQQQQQYQQSPASVSGSNRSAQREKSREKFEEPPQQGRNSVVSQSQGSLSIQQQQQFPPQPFTPQQKSMLPPKSNNFVDTKRQNNIPKSAPQQLEEDQPAGYQQHSQPQQYYQQQLQQQQQQESQLMATLINQNTQENSNRVSNRIKERSDSKTSKELNNIDNIHFQSVSSVQGNKDNTNHEISERDFDGWEDKLDEKKSMPMYQPSTSGVQMKQQSQVLHQLQTQQHQEIMMQQQPQEYSESVGRLSISPQELDIRAADYFDSACGAKIIHYITHLASSQDSNSNAPNKSSLETQGNKELCMLFADLSTETHANLLRSTANNRNLSLNNDGIVNNIQLRYLPLYLEDLQLLTAKEPKSLSLPNGDIFIFGGNDAGQVLKLDWSNSSLTAYGQPMKQVVYDFGICLLRHSVFIIGGVISSRLNSKNEEENGKGMDFLTSSSCQKFNIRTGKWENISSMNEAVAKPSVCAFNNRFIFRIGGFLPSGQPSKNIEKYDIILNKWYQISLPVFQFTLPPSAAVSQINPRQLIIVGGLLEQTTASKRVMVLSIDENRDPESVGISSREENFSYSLQQMPSLQLAVPSAFQAIPFIFGGCMHLLDSDVHTNKMQLHLFNGKTWNTILAAI